MPEQDPRRVIVTSLFEQAIHEGKPLNLSQVRRLAGYAATSRAVYDMYWGMSRAREEAGLPVPPIEKIVRAQQRKNRIAEARSGDNPIPFKKLAPELGIEEGSARSIASATGVTETILTTEETKVFRNEVLRMWNQGLSQTEMVPLLQEIGYKATTSQLAHAIRVLREGQLISEEPAKVRRQKFRDERFIQEILSEKDATQICEDMNITPRVFEVLELRLRERIRARMQSEHDIAKIATKMEQRRVLERKWAHQRPTMQAQEIEQQAAPMEYEEEPETTAIQDPQEETAEPPVEQLKLLEARKNQIKEHFINLRTKGGMVIPDGPVLVAETQAMARFEELNKISFRMIQILFKGASAVKYKLSNYRVNPTKVLSDPIALIKKNYQYDKHAPDESGIQSYLWQHLRLFTEKLLTSTNIAYSDEDVIEVLESFFVSS